MLSPLLCSPCLTIICQLNLSMPTPLISSHKQNDDPQINGCSGTYTRSNGTRVSRPRPNAHKLTFRARTSTVSFELPNTQMVCWPNGS